MEPLTNKQKHSLQSGVSAVLLAKSYAQVKREEVDAVYRDILNTFKVYTNSDKSRCEVERITENKDLWQANDSDYKDITD